MIHITPALLRAATGCTQDAADIYAEHLDAAALAYRINTPERAAAWLAQLAHESGSLRSVREIASGEAYEGRADLGNTQPGDGQRYRGRGLIQCTGRHNYAWVRDRLRDQLGAARVPDFEATPEALEQPEWACWSAACWWALHGCNELADAGNHIGIGRLINRGSAKSTRPANGEGDRLRRLDIAQRAIGAQLIDTSAGSVDSAPADQHIEPSTEAPMPNTMPAGEADSTPPASTGGSTLGAFLTAAGAVAAKALAVSNPLAGALVGTLAPLVQDKLARELGRHTDKPEVAQQVAGALVQAAQRATGLDDPVDAVSAARRSPQAVAAVEASAVDTLDRLAPVLERLEAMGRQAWQDTERATADAHSRNADDQLMIDTPWVKLRFIHLLSLAFACFSGWFVTLNWPSLTPELKGTVITLMIVAGWTGVRDYWMGSSRQSAAKDTLNAELARRIK